MGWGGGWGNHVPQSGRDVAKAFYEGRALSRSSCRTDGRSYWFISHGKDQIEIARRLSTEDEILAHVEAALNGLPHRKPLEFNTAGWRTHTTARHFCALGLKAECIGMKSPRFKVNGRYIPDEWAGWFTLDDVVGWPEEHPDDKAAREKRERRELARQYRQGRAFVQMTMALPF